MIPSFQIPRRRFLRGLGTSMALPFLESANPLQAALSAEGGVPSPRRMAFVYVPNGINMSCWAPESEDGSLQLGPTLEPLKGLKSEFSILSGLTHDKARANGDGAGDHARASATFLTAMQARKTQGADIRVGQSIDQFVATKIVRKTRFASLELGCDRSQLSGNCDSGYSCAYSFNIAWKSEATPMPPEVDPRLAFERLFSTGDPNESAESRARRERYQKSILDFVLEDARSLQSKLGRNDRRKLDEYLSAVRELEQRIEMTEKATLALPHQEKPAGIPPDYAEHIRLMFDLMHLSFLTDTTRVATFVMAHDGSNRPYPHIGVDEGHHDLSHHGNSAEKKEKIAKIDRFHMEQFAYFLDRLKKTQEGTGSLLDQCMIVYGSGIEDGNSHAHHNLPVILAGRGGGTISPGRHIRYAKNTPMANMFLSLAERMGVEAERFGDSNGKLGQLTV
ncbi:MAG: DUF1552 domain-containing protein [Pedosphaera sp.]|nr:DUF1552 domain-containing protein [Pedosphaera sp.]